MVSAKNGLINEAATMAATARKGTTNEAMEATPDFVTIDTTNEAMEVATRDFVTTGAHRCIVGGRLREVASIVGPVVGTRGMAAAADRTVASVAAVLLLREAALPKIWVAVVEMVATALTLNRVDIVKKIRSHQ